MRQLLVVALVVAVASCGDDIAPPVDAGADFAGTYCEPETATCGAVGCGVPCDSSKDTWCTDHGCFERLSCQCVANHWICSIAGRGCDLATPWQPGDLAASD